MAASTSQIPLAYRVMFLWVDPIVCVGTAVVFVLNKSFMLSGLSPLLADDIYKHDRNPAYDPLIWQLFGFYLLVAVLQGGLCRYTADVNVWKFTNLGILAVDLSMLWSIGELAGLVGGLSDNIPLRTDDLVNIAVATIAAAFRIAFIAEVGFAKNKGKVQ